MLGTTWSTEKLSNSGVISSSEFQVTYCQFSYQGGPIYSTSPIHMNIVALCFLLNDNGHLNAYYKQGTVLRALHKVTLILLLNREERDVL